MVVMLAAGLRPSSSICVHSAVNLSSVVIRAVIHRPVSMIRPASSTAQAQCIDIVGSFASFLEASLLAEGFRLVHAPGIAVNRAGQGFAGGERKSDPRDARTIADLVRTRDLRTILPDDATVTAIRLKVGRRRDLTEEKTRRLTRLRALLCSVHPGLERELDVTCKGPLTLLARYVTPTEIRQAGKRRIVAYLVKTPHLRAAERLADQALAAAHAQSLAVAGEAAIAELVREMALEALENKAKIARIDHDLAALLAAHPDSALIESLPGMGGCSWRSSSPASATSNAFRRPMHWLLRPALRR